MIARPGIWKEVWVGAYVKDKTGRTWKVEDLIFAGPTAKLRDKNGIEGKIPWPADDTPVTIMEWSMADAVALVAEKLDAKEV
jgi:hypothetical protein